MRAITSALVSFALVGTSLRATAQESASRSTDRFDLSARSESYVRLFRRALLPGPSGAVVESETLAPVYEYVSLRASRLDAPRGPRDVELQVAGWVRGLPIGGRIDPAMDGDVQTAFVGMHARPFEVRLGRQQVVGGAARFSRFDGVLLALDRVDGVSARAYAGLTVLPRWNEQAHYLHLGSAADSLVRDTSVAEELQRRRYWLGGASLSYEARGLSVSTSFHEQREEGELARRNLGLDAQGRLSDVASLGGSGVLDADSGRLADGRVWLDVAPAPPLTLALEYLHTEPALWLSRQSVLSVFSTDRFDEVGGAATLRLVDGLQLDASSFATLYDDHRPGGRAEAALRVALGGRTTARIGYRRVLTSDNGYHALRASLQRRLARQLVATLESYQYLYDRAVFGYRASSVYATSLGYEPAESWSVLWGASLTRSPYAALDAQTLVRLQLSWDVAAGGGPR